MTRATLTEARDTASTAPVAQAPGRFLVELITPGWGSSGYYSPQVLESAAQAEVFPAGLHMYLDHPSASESIERPERSVRDLAAVLTEAARWDGNALVAEAAVFGPYREVLGQMSEAIGVSIRAAADVTDNAQAEGRRGRVVNQLVEGLSADFVTRAGRGGRIVEVLESARTVEEQRNIGQWIESRLHRDFTITADDMAGDGRLTREERISLSSAIGDALTAFVGRLEADQPQLYQRDLWDDPQDTVAAAMEAARNVPATRPDDPTPSQEDTMPQIEESRLRELEEAHGRVPTLESERDAERQRAEAAEARATALEEANAQRARRDRAGEIIAERSSEAGVTFTALESRGLVADLPVTSDGALDEAAFTTAVNEAAAEKAQHSGAGTVRGVTTRRPADGDQGEVSEADVTSMIRRRAGITEQKGA
jgi:hypothetical protein